MIYKFERDAQSGIILVYVMLDDEYSFKMALDTAASITTFDINALHVAGFPMGNMLETNLVETSSGFMEVDVIQVDSIAALGHTVRNVSVQVYDFLSHGILSDYEGLLGIDFFENTTFCIDMKNQTIEIKNN